MHITTHIRRPAVALAGTAALALTLTACAGGAGSSGSSSESGSGDGFAYDAPQEEVDAAIADLDPITVTFQGSAASQESVMAPASTEFERIVEERSGGKIDVEIVWGQAVAGYAEVHDALADGRIDVAFTLPIYMPQEYPGVDAMGTALAGAPPSPFMGEMVANAMANNLAWEDEELLANYDEKGLQPLTPVAASGGYYTVCTEPIVSVDDWQGRQVRIAGTAQAAQVTAMGGTPVSMDYTETFEALQRGTVDCTLAQLVPSAEAGILEVAPHIGHMTDQSFSRAPGAYLAGKTFWDGLPLAYQQILFDSNAMASAGGMLAVIGGNADAMAQAKEHGGTVQPFDSGVEDAVAETTGPLLESAVEAGNLPEDIETRIEESVSGLESTFAELGYEDAGDTADFDEWFDWDTDFEGYARASYEDAGLEHRPS
ncbi:TRAP transporter substrate-binding protein DctP [Brevibacterium litoralis]|uniref:TRAP transporter substrate-binding protein DctP n=1 Tax=Brevibacterium litoralis TaxID=3138935 RepID=UPI0032EDAE7C